ncbi:MAG: damage-inducible protein DinB [Oscillatoriales cyanobacterium RM1_1_9]|nr:damage-inducible protein DinB [Oscillatoriales cyanobacterium SM2_3_0]NJO44264.1 damage-inducible protein DinB [Oscillatoriales cyanobacterium RM2_1_1]NJO70875.1 damage-inducible protein DinB [Oscillatoriales cyanobacterium RM1_1_9]
MTLIAHFQQLTCYNTLANQRLYQVCAQLTETDRQQLRPAFFKSIHATLNHILVGDRIWMSRFREGVTPVIALDAVLYENFAELWAKRIQADVEIEQFFSALPEERISQTLQYRNSSGHLHTDPLNLLMAHFFNHQTHHRGQVHDMLSQTRIKPPSLDMHQILRPGSQS